MRLKVFLRAFLPVFVVLANVSLIALAGTFQATGTFQYEDRIWTKDGYTGAVQNLPIRHADVELVDNNSNAVLGFGSTDASGSFSITATSAGATADVFARILSSTNNSATYHVSVRVNFNSTIHAVPTVVTFGHNTTTDLHYGVWLLQDTDGTGVAQAFNIMDRAIDGMNYLSQVQVLNRFPSIGEALQFRWSPSGTSGGSFYFNQNINIAQPGSGDTDGWADTVILHEMGHYVSDLFHQDDNPGGSHFLADNFQDPRLSYGEGYATLFCAEAREYTALVEGTDDHVSIYADLGIPPTVGTPGALEFSYDFEAGVFGNGVSIGQVGQANETNITSALWDIIDGPATPDESPGVDDDLLDDNGADFWQVLTLYMRTLPGAETITFEDFQQGWVSVFGPLYKASELAFINNTLNNMGFELDAFEADDTIPTASAFVVPSYGIVGISGGVVINEIEVAGEDAIELFNSSDAPVDITNWKLLASTNTESDITFTFPSYVLGSGAFVYVRERGDAVNNTPVDLYDSAFSIPWSNGAPGACELQNAATIAVDFVRWDGSADSSTTVIPAGLVFTGSVTSPAGGTTIGRDSSGTDTDAGADWSAAPNSGTQPNGLAFQARTNFDVGDIDHLSLALTEGKIYTVTTFSLLGAADTFLELIDTNGMDVIGSNVDRGGILNESRLTFVAPATGTYFVRITNISALTDFGIYSVRAYEHPSTSQLLPPLSLNAVANNIFPNSDPVEVSWLNGSLYDSVQVSIVGPTSRAAIFSGTTTSWSTTLDQGVHTLSVHGVLAGTPTSVTTNWVYAGPPQFTYSNDFSNPSLTDWGADNNWATTTNIANSGPSSATDSPTGNYADNQSVSLELRVPVRLEASPTLSFQHICITEADFDFGIVEVTDNDGQTWSQLAIFDMADHPEWNDGSASNNDWIQENISLAAFVNKSIRVRFRLSSDASVTEDGWYIDDIAINQVLTDSPVATPSHVFSLGQNHPNPFNPQTNIRYSIAKPEKVHLAIYDMRGRLVRTLVEEKQVRGTYESKWNGLNNKGSRVASGVYFYRIEAGDFVRSKKLIMVK